MNYIANIKLKLTKCSKCIGCNQLEIETFTGDNKCKDFRDGMSSKKG